MTGPRGFSHCTPQEGFNLRYTEMTKGFQNYIDEYEYWRKCKLRKGYPGDPFFINPE